MFMKRVLGLGMVYSCLFSFPYDIYFFFLLFIFFVV